MPSSLDQLKQFTTVVADTGDFDLIDKYKPQDSTTNPSLIFSAFQKPQYSKLVDDALEYGKKNGNTEDEKVEKAMDKLAVNFGCEILKIVPGRVSTEIDARLSYDTEGTVAKARELVALYKEAGIDASKRVLLKIASTWEGLQAARILEQEGLHVNMTLMFSLAQAMVAADVGATLISPFVGRITDFYKQKENKDGYPAAEDPGVLSVNAIYNYYKANGFKTVVMGASFRNPGQILELAGCDLLTVSPALLEKLSTQEDAVVQKLTSDNAKSSRPKKVLGEKEFRWEMCSDEMAHFKLAEGIRKFSNDLVKLETEIRNKVKA